VARSGDLSGGIEFALDSFDVVDGRLVVAGRWFGVTGRRFVRPVLQAPGQRRVIAVLDHKPWPADDGAQWLAAFPYDGYGGPSRLQVAPDIAVELPAAGPEAGDGKLRPARLARPAPQRPLETEPAVAEMPPAPPRRQTSREKKDAGRLAELEAERDVALAEIEAIRQARDEARVDADRLRGELDQIRSELEHVRTDADTAQTELERLRRTPAKHAYIAPRPMAFREPEPGPGWQLRVVAAFAIAAVFVALFRLFGLL
jgi:hypothetical protein